MNEAVKIGSYEDNDYYGNEKSSSFSQLLKFIASKLRILPSSNPLGIQTIPASKPKPMFHLFTLDFFINICMILLYGEGIFF